MATAKKSATEDGQDRISLEVSNIRFRGATLEVQLRADRDRDKPRWWPTNTNDVSAAAAQFKAISEALEKSRPVLAEMKATADESLTIDAISIQYAETTR